jgi:hypothetical protein
MYILVLLYMASIEILGVFHIFALYSFFKAVVSSILSRIFECSMLRGDFVSPKTVNESGMVSKENSYFTATCTLLKISSLRNCQEKNLPVHKFCRSVQKRTQIRHRIYANHGRLFCYDSPNK